MNQTSQMSSDFPRQLYTGDIGSRADVITLSLTDLQLDISDESNKCGHGGLLWFRVQ